MAVVRRPNFRLRVWCVAAELQTGGDESRSTNKAQGKVPRLPTRRPQPPRQRHGAAHACSTCRSAALVLCSSGRCYTGYSSRCRPSLSRPRSGAMLKIGQPLCRPNVGRQHRLRARRLNCFWLLYASSPQSLITTFCSRADVPSLVQLQAKLPTAAARAPATHVHMTVAANHPPTWRGRSMGPVGVDSIFRTTSMPSTISPNTQWRPSSLVAAGQQGGSMGLASGSRRCMRPVLSISQSACQVTPPSPSPLSNKTQCKILTRGWQPW